MAGTLANSLHRPGLLDKKVARKPVWPAMATGEYHGMGSLRGRGLNCLILAQNSLLQCYATPPPLLRRS